eukprot:TRINITY_DN23741_c0_g2_i1.p1 TRINITY_DN23741_c0_g2~~TRINITY_DN23741_c0_g2_i1.p1  ORF type:complete len:825 (+),score=187.02 TRINITY_DN23741_c0_g2_i1:57-2477(+)
MAAAAAQTAWITYPASQHSELRGSGVARPHSLQDGGAPALPALEPGATGSSAGAASKLTSGRFLGLSAPLCFVWAVGLRAAVTSVTGRPRRGQSGLFGRGSWLKKSSSATQRAAAGDGGSSSAGDEKAGNSYVLDALVLPTLGTIAACFIVYLPVTSGIRAFLDPVALDVIKGDLAQFMQNWFNFNGLLFSFFASTTYAILYQQQVMVYKSLYNEVTQARSLLEQLTLISQARPNYRGLLKSMRDYTSEMILGVRFGCPPAVLVSAKPANDPLENILYLTSVGVPSAVYDTVRSLRDARGQRLGAIQRKLPEQHFSLLRASAALELFAFPLLGAGISTYEPADVAALPGHVIFLEAGIFALLAGCISLALRITEDLRTPTGGLYTIAPVLDDLVGGLREDIDRRLQTVPDDMRLGEVSAIGTGKNYELRDNIGDTSEGDVRELEEQIRMLPPFARRFFQATSSYDPDMRLKVAEAIVSCEAGEECVIPDEQEDDLFNSLEPKDSSEASNQRYLTLSLQVGLAGALLFPFLTRLIDISLSQETLQSIREDNNAQWLQDFFTAISLLFSLIVSQVFGFLYGQQEAIYMAFYQEVSVAKALLEQVTLVARNRGNNYADMLRALRDYVREDMNRLEYPPALLLSSRSGAAFFGRPDPLETILYLTSVGTPSYVYSTVQSLRKARGARLGALQRKLPEAVFTLLQVLGVLELSVFPVVAAGCDALDLGASFLPGHIIFFQALVFGLMTSAVTVTLVALSDLWSPSGDAYNVATVHEEMVSGLDQELELRLTAQMKKQDREASLKEDKAVPA